MAGELVGSVFVRVRAITEQLGKDIEDGVAKGMADVNAGDEADKLGKSIGGDIGDGVEGVVDKAVPDAVGKSIGKAEKAGGKKAEKAGASLGKRLSDAFGKNSDNAKFDKFLDKIKKKFDAIKLPLKPLLYGLLVPVIIKGLTLITQYVISLVGQLGFLVTAAVGGGAAMAGAFAFAALAILPLTLGFKARTKDFEKLQKKAKELSFHMGEIGKEVQKRMMPGVADFVMSLFHLIAPFREFASGIGFLFGVFLSELADIIKWAAKAGYINQIFNTSSYIFNLLTITARNFVIILIRFFVAVQPIARSFVLSLTLMVEHWRDLANAGDGTNLQATLLIFYARAQQVARAFGDLFKAIWNIFKLGADESGSFFNTFSYFAGYWKNFTESDKGKDRIREVFRGVNDIVHEVNGLFSDLIKLLFNDAVDGENDSSVVGFIKWLRQTFIPYLSDTVMPAFQKLKKPLGDLVAELIKVATKMAELGTLDKMIAILDAFLSIMTEILKIPHLAEFVSWMAAFGFALSIIAHFMGPFIVLAKGFGKVWALFNIPFGGAGLSVAARVFSKLGFAAATLLTALETLGTFIAGVFGVTLASSATAIAIAIGAIIAVFVAAYLVFRNWKTIAKWVDIAWDALWRFVTTIPEKLQALWEILKRFGSTALEVFKNLPQTIGNALSSLGGLLSTALSSIGSFLLGLGQSILSGIQQIPGLLLSLVQQLAGIGIKLAASLFNWIIEAAKKVPGYALQFIQAVITALLNLPALILKGLLKGAQALTGFIGAAARLAAPLIGRYIALLINVLITLPIKIATVLFKAGTALFSWILKAIPKIAGYIAKFIGIIIGALIGIPLVIAVALTKATIALVKWIIDAAPKAYSAFVDFSKKVGGWIAGFVTSLPERFSALASAVWDWIKKAVPLAATKLNELGQSAFSWAIQFTIDLPGRLAALATSIWSWVTQAVFTAGSKLAQIATAAFTWAIQFVTDLPSTLASLATEIWGWVSEAVKNAVSKLGELLTAITDWLIGLPGALFTSLVDTGKAIAGKLVEGVAEGLRSLPGGDAVADALGLPGGMLLNTVNAAIATIRKVSDGNLQPLSLGFDIVKPKMPNIPVPDVPAYKRGGFARKGSTGGFLAQVADGGFDELILSLDPNLKARNQSLISQAGLLPNANSDGIVIQQLNVNDSQNGVNGALAIIREVSMQKWLNG